MPTRSNNRIIIDLKKVAYAWRFWRNQYGRARSTKPVKPTWHGTHIEPDAIAYPYDHSFPRETLAERICRLSAFDVWTPTLKLRLSAADVVEFTGPRAESLWRAYSEMQFNPKRKKKK